MTTMSRRLRRTFGPAAVLCLTVTGAAACGEDSSPLEVARNKSSAPATSTGDPASSPSAAAPPSRKPTTSKRAPSRSATATATETPPASGGPADRFVADPCAVATPEQVASSLGLPVVRAAKDEEMSGSATLGTFCDYYDASGKDLMTIMVSTSPKSLYTAPEAARSSLADTDVTTPVPGVGDAAFYYNDGKGKSGLVMAVAAGSDFLDVDVWVDGTKPVPDAAAFTRLGKAVAGNVGG